MPKDSALSPLISHSSSHLEPPFLGSEDGLAPALSQKELYSPQREDWDKSSKKVGTFADKIKAFGILVAAGSFKAIKCVVTLEFIRTPCKALFNQIFHRETPQLHRSNLSQGYTNAIKAQFEGVQPFEKGQAFDLGQSPAATPFEIAEFENALDTFSNRLEALAQNPTELRAEIVKLSQYTAYQKLKETKHPAVEFLQECANRLESANMSDALAEYGEKKIGRYLLASEKKTLSFKQYGTALQAGQQSFDNSRDTPIATLLWAADNLGRLAHVLTAQAFDPLEYNSYDNQMVFIAGTLEDGEGRIIHKYSPGLTGPQSVAKDLLIPLYKKEGRRWIHIDNQSVHEAGEKRRIDEIHKWATDDASKGTFIHAVLSTDTLDAVNKDLINKYKKDEITYSKFVEEYEAALRGHNDCFIRDYDQCHGIHIPEELLDQEELEAAFRIARELTLENPNMSDMSKVQKVDCLRRNILSVLSWSIMKKEQHRELENPEKPSIFTMNCKENIDRGPQENEDMLFNESMSKDQKEISIDEAFIQAGINLGRADVAMHRPPQLKRMLPMLNRQAAFAEKVNPRNRNAPMDAAFQLGKLKLQGLRAILMPRAPENIRQEPRIPPDLLSEEGLIAKNQRETKKKSDYLSTGEGREMVWGNIRSVTFPPGWEELFWGDGFRPENGLYDPTAY